MDSQHASDVYWHEIMNTKQRPLQQGRQQVCKQLFQEGQPLFGKQVCAKHLSTSQGEGDLYL